MKGGLTKISAKIPQILQLYTYNKTEILVNTAKKRDTLLVYGFYSRNTNFNNGIWQKL